MSSRELAARMARPSSEKPILLDVRTEAEFAVSHLEGARRIDPDNPDLSSLDLSPKSTVVVYCSVGYRSAGIVGQLRQAGIARVYNLTGGIFQWANEGRPSFAETSESTMCIRTIGSPASSSMVRGARMNPTVRKDTRRPTETRSRRSLRGR